jgi:hypothetical protein
LQSEEIFMAGQPEADLFFSPWLFWRAKFMLFEIVTSSKVYRTGHFTARGGPAIA